MALGDSTKKQNFENNYFSRAKFNNYEAKRMISFCFWKGYLKIVMNEIIESYSGVEYKERTYIHLSPNKAYLLKEQLEKFLYLPKEESKIQCVGVDTGINSLKNFIAIGYTENKDDLSLTIGKLDTTSGNITEKYSYTFNQNYHYGIQWSDLDKMKFDSVYNDRLELENLLIILDEYVKSMTGAMAYSVLDLGRFDYTRLNNKTDAIIQHLGIDYKSSKQQFSGNSGTSNSYFNKNGLGAASPENTNRARSERTTIEDLA